MELSQIQVGKTYKGDRDYKRGLGPHRTVIEVDQLIGVVTLRNEVGAKPPECYVMLACMSLADFAAWAEGEARELLPTPAQKVYLAGYLPDLLGADPDLVNLPREDFVRMVANKAFDGVTTAGETRRAMNLRQKGVFSDLVVHDDQAGQPCLAVTLAVKGAAILFDLMQGATK